MQLKNGTKIFVNGKPLKDSPLVEDLIRGLLSDWDVKVNSSGTTGEPKPVQHTTELIRSISKKNVERMNLDYDSRLMSIYSPKGIAYTVLSLYPAVLTGCDLYIETNTLRYTTRLKEIEPTHTLITPNLWKAIHTSDKWKDLDLSFCKQMMMGSDFVPNGALEDLRSKGVKEAINVYGNTEVPPLVLTSSDNEWYSYDDFAEGVVHAFIGDELFIKWDSQDELTATGDLVEHDGDQFRFVGRAYNMFKLDGCGTRVYPEQVEKIAIDNGASLALCQKKNNKGVLYYTGVVDENKLKEEIDLPIRIKQVNEIKIDNNLGKVIRNQEVNEI